MALWCGPSEPHQGCVRWKSIFRAFLLLLHLLFEDHGVTQARRHLRRSPVQPETTSALTAEQVARGFTQFVLKNLQGRRRPNLSGHPAPQRGGSRSRRFLLRIPLQSFAVGDWEPLCQAPGHVAAVGETFSPADSAGALPSLPSPVTPPGLARYTQPTLPQGPAGLFLPALAGDGYFFVPRLLKHFCTVRLESAL